jgi:Na+/phosphate symporter
LVGSFFLPTLPQKSRNDVKQDVKDVKDVYSNDEIALMEFQNNIMKMFDEMEQITDTLSKLIDKKENLTYNDSLFMVEKYSRLQEIDSILNEQINIEFE